MDPLDLERLIDRELKRLPVPRAPRTLLPRVMRAVEAASRAPARTAARGWRTWPALWQAASVVAFALVVLGAINLWPVAQEAFNAMLAGRDSGLLGRVAEVVRDFDALASAGRVVWRELVQPLALFAFAVLAVMMGACALFGTALRRVALGGAFLQK